MSGEGTSKKPSRRRTKRRRAKVPRVARDAGHELLLEVRVEEMPPRLVEQAIRQLAGRLFEELMSLGLGPEEVITGATRRRLVVCCRGLPARAPDHEKRVLGPPRDEAYDVDGAPTAALAGFVERMAVSPEAVATVPTERGTYVAVVQSVRGASLADALSGIIPRVLAEIVPSQRMTWATGHDPWLRPVRSLIALLDGEVLPIVFCGVVAGRTTVGHPILSPDQFEVANHADHLARLAERGIVPAVAERIERLTVSLAALADAAGAVMPDAPSLVRRMALSCEVPGLIEGAISADLLTSLPGEIVVAALAQHPGAVVLQAPDGALLPRFVTVMDREADPEGRVRAGYERVVAGRLADARFHRDVDARVPLAQRARSLSTRPLRPGHGSWADHCTRVGALAAVLAERQGVDVDRDTLNGAATLLAADRATSMVNHLPRLQGMIGGLYARDEGFAEPVWQALYDQHQPREAGGTGPRGLVGLLVAIAGRVDRLVAALGAEPLPSVNKDRHGLRDLAHGLVRLLLDERLALDVDLVLARAVLLHGDQLARGQDATVADGLALIVERTRLVLGQRGFATDEIEAAMAIRHDDLHDLHARVGALRDARNAPYFRALVLAAKRLVNMLRDTEAGAVEPQLLVEPAEQALHEALVSVREAVDTAVRDRRHGDALAAMEGLTEPLDRFFADVLILDEDQARRANRLALLEAVRRVFWRLARLKEMAIDEPDSDSR